MVQTVAWLAACSLSFACALSIKLSKAEIWGVRSRWGAKMFVYVGCTWALSLFLPNLVLYLETWDSILWIAGIAWLSGHLPFHFSLFLADIKLMSANCHLFAAIYDICHLHSSCPRHQHQGAFLYLHLSSRNQHCHLLLFLSAATIMYLIPTMFTFIMFMCKCKTVLMMTIVYSNRLPLLMTA